MDIQTWDELSNYIIALKQQLQNKDIIIKQLQEEHSKCKSKTKEKEAS